MSVIHGKRCWYGSGPFLSTYQIALKNGFRGTEKEWLNAIGTMRSIHVTERSGGTFACDASLGQVLQMMEDGFIPVLITVEGLPAFLSDVTGEVLSFSTGMIRDIDGDYYDCYSMSGREHTVQKMTVSGSEGGGGSIGPGSITFSMLNERLQEAVQSAESAVQPEDLEDYVPVDVFRDIEEPSTDLIEVKRDPETGRLYVLGTGSPAPTSDNTRLITMTGSGSNKIASMGADDIHDLISDNTVNLVLIDVVGRECLLIGEPMPGSGQFSPAKFATIDDTEENIIVYSVYEQGIVSEATISIGEANYGTQNAGKPLVVGSDGTPEAGDWPDEPDWEDVVPDGGIPATDLAGSIPGTKLVEGVVPNVYYFENETQYNGQADNILPGAYVYIEQNVGEISLYRRGQSGKDLIGTFAASPTELSAIFATRSMVGAPKAAATVADMSDTDSIYVYTGSETGYVAGNWYYYEQGSWVSGGIYNAVAFTTDPTLTQPGEAADAAAVGVVKGRLEAFGMAVIDAFKKIGWLDTDGEETLAELEDILFPAQEVASISAVFEQGQTVVYDSDSLDSLKPMLSVTATYSDATTGVVTAYTLSGTLTAGTSTITVSYRGKTTTFTVIVTHAASLDDIAYGTTTYREMFLTNNVAFLGDFEGNITLSSTDVTWASGKTYKISAGDPVLTTDYSSSPSHSLKAFGSGSTQLKMTAPYVSLPAGTYLVACMARCDRYSAGKLGFQFLPRNTTSETVNAVITEVTNDFVPCVAIGTFAANRTGFEAFVGSISSANLDGYVDDVIATPIPSDMTLEQAQALYANYIAIIRGNAE